MGEDMLSGYITTAEASDRYGYSQEYIRQMVRAGVVGARKVGYQWFVDEADLQRHQAEMERLGTRKFRPRRGEADE